MVYNYDCRWFTGYKPCQYKRACQDCPHYDQVKSRVAIVSLEAMGAVLRSTCLLAPIKKKWPDCHVTWFTLKVSAPLLKNNPHIDRLVVVDGATAALSRHLEFDRLYAVDKSLEAGALAEQIQAKEKFGFGLNKNGVIVPLNDGAKYQYDLGLDDHQKFFVNQKPETQQITETMDLHWERDPYVLEFSEEEKDIVAERRRAILNLGVRGVIGYNTGCSTLFPYKKFTVHRAIEVIAKWRSEYPDYAVALLGGPEDEYRQEQMKNAFPDDPLVINTPTRQGLRSGIQWMATADMVLSGCSLGLHIAIALQKPVIAWFGVSCIQEIDVYDRGVKIQSDVSCSPCWKKSCQQTIKCFDMVAVDRISLETGKILQA